MPQAISRKLCLLLAATLLLSACSASSPQPDTQAATQPDTAAAVPTENPPDQAASMVEPANSALATDDIAPTLISMEVDASEYRRLFDAALLVLRDAGFTLDRRDYRMGVITTRPLAAPTIFEPWNSSRIASSKLVENTLNYQRLIVRIQLQPIPATATDTTTSAAITSADYQLIVTAMVERQQRPNQRLEGSTDPDQLVSAYRLHPLAGDDRSRWQHQGHDPALDTEPA
ncbi:MAG: hypothetical protein HC898_03515 [Phycisphaerales bacterium]|nr:hypothetical protein [Phycisphaerales bacterium]